MIRSFITALAALALAAPPLIAGAPVPAGITLDLPVLPDGKTLTLEYDTIVQPLGGNTSDISTQATITADAGINVLSDDPDQGGAADPTTTGVFENAAPATGTVVAANVGAAEDGNTSYSFTVEYTDDGVVTDVDVSSIDGGDVTVTGPGGPVTVTTGIEPSGMDGTPKTATYTITPPGGSWDSGDNGTYTIGMVGMQVADVGSGPALFVAANPALATFDVNVPDPSYTIVALDADKPEGNSGTTDFTFTVARGGDTSTMAGSVDYTITGADAADFSSPLTGTIPFPIGSSSETLTVQVVGDTDVEGDEAFTVTLSNPMPTPGTVIGMPDSADGTIRTDDATLAVSAFDADKLETNSGNQTYTFNVARTGFLDEAVTVNWAVTGSGANPVDADDFGGTLPSGVATFNPGDPVQTVPVSGTGDLDFELDEGFTVTISGSSGPPITTDTASGTILNDDVLSVEIAANDADADENTPDPGNFRVTRNSTLGPLEVQIALDPASTATPAVDFGLGGVMLAGGAGAVTIPDGDSFVDIALNPIDDIPAEADETATLNITPDAAYAIGASGSDTVTIAANDFVVTNADDFDSGTNPDDGEGTLRQAMLNANALGGLPTISFDGPLFSSAPQKIMLTAGELFLSNQVTIDGPTAPGRVTVDAVDASRVMRISGGATGSVVRRLTITGGNGIGPGAGIWMVGPTVDLVDCFIQGNTCTGSGGGGVDVTAGGTLRMRGCTISDNEGGKGGGIQVFGSSLVAVNCTISGNRANIQGGGINLDTSSSSAVLDDITITGNHADADESGEADHTGGGIQANAGSSCTLNNTIVAGNIRDAVVPLPSDIEGAVVGTSHHNLISLDTGLTGITNGTNGNQIGTAGSPIDPLLGPLSDNGGPTLTHAILPASPALDTGDPAFNPAAFTPPLDFDQRGPGFVRVFNGRIDIGAFELPNVPPMVAADLPMVTVDEGSEATNTGSFSDTPGDMVTITADIGTITMQDPGHTGTWSWSYTPDDGPAMETVTITATDALMVETTTTFDLDVNNVSPAVVFDPIDPIDENGVATVTGTITDPGVLDTFTLDIDWGDPSSPPVTEQFPFSASATGSQTFSFTHQYLDDNPTATPSDNYSISGTVTDNDAGSGMDSVSVTVNDVAPVVVLDPISDIDENGMVTLSGTITDPGTLDTFTLDIDWGDPLSPGNFEQIMLPPSPSGSQIFMVMHHYLDDNPTGTARDDYTVQVTVTDDDTLNGSDSETFQISNVRPELVLDPVMSIDENGTATLTGTITDPGTLDTFSMFVDWGDPLAPDNYEMPTFGMSATGTQTFTLTHQYPDDNPSGTPQDNKTIFVLLLDDEGASTTELTGVQIDNVAPEITSLVATPVPGGATLDVAFTDPGTPDVHTVQILWGDGSSTPLTLPIGDRSFQTTHSYAMPPPPGGYSITVTVTDDDTGSDTDSTGPPVPPAGPSEIDGVMRLANGDIEFGFDTVLGAIYRIQYSSDLLMWKNAVPDIVGDGNRVPFVDSGPPVTESHPSTVPKRFYRYIRLPGMMPPP